MHHSFLPLSQPQTSSSCSNGLINSNPINTPVALVEKQADKVLPQLVPCQETKVESCFLLADQHFANARRSKLLNSLSKEEAAQTEEGNLLLPYDWMYSEIDASSYPYAATQTTQLNLASHFPNPISVNSNHEHPADAQTIPSTNHFAREIFSEFSSDFRYQSEDFMMFKFKVTRCRKNFPHDRDTCTYAHVGERSARRDPLKYTYLGELCEEYHSTGHCRFAKHCRKAHGVFEFWLHPTRYRTKMCDRGINCWRLICFFAHTAGEKRRDVYGDDANVPSCDDEFFKFGNIGAAKLFGGFMPNFSTEKSNHDRNKPSLGCGKSVKLEFSGDDNRSDLPKVIFDIIEELGIL